MHSAMKQLSVKVSQGENEYHFTSMLYTDDTFTMVVLCADDLRKIWKAENLPNLYRALNQELVGLSSYTSSFHLLRASVSSSGTVPPLTRVLKRALRDVE